MKTILTLLTTLRNLRARLWDDDDLERGSGSLEQVIITVALLGLAAGVVAAITAAVNSRIGSII